MNIRPKCHTVSLCMLAFTNTLLSTFSHFIKEKTCKNEFISLIKGRVQDVGEIILNTFSFNIFIAVCKYILTI